ncbi:MAG: Cell division protein FtsQ, partial [Verrucomicrobiales bacterium]|nr:Cell division protein FtsQ [Verrucomicrobiales bacterium]
QVESEQVKAALKFLSEFERSPMAGLVDFQRIDISAPETLHIYTGQGSEVLFPLVGLEAQLRRWRLIWDQSQRWGKSIATLDLSIANNVPLKLLDGVLAEKPVISKNIKTPRTKKKHV